VNSASAHVDELAPARSTLHLIAAHILGRARSAAVGHFGLRAAPGGIATPAFGAAPEVLRISGTELVREIGGACTWAPIAGSTLRQLGDFAGVDLDAPFSAGNDTPALDDTGRPLELDAAAADVLAAWFALCWEVIDAVIGSLAPGATATTVQLWPEHFDAATAVTLPAAEPVTLGFSPGDGFEPEPYLYVGPSTAARPKDPSFWNAPFGAVRRRSELVDLADPAGTCRQFLETGLDLVASVPAGS
jgi:hypothetical protein